MKESGALLRIANFDLAFRRLQNSSNWQYKRFSRHLFSAYELSRKANIRHLIADIRSNSYEPSSATLVYYPKASGVLRPLALLSVQDQIVYQALTNIIAMRFRTCQNRLKDKKTFGAIYTGNANNFFYRNWKSSYQNFNRATAQAFSRGQTFYSEFDLVSFYEIIDHNILRGILRQKGLSEDFLDLLFKCISKWTTCSTSELHHGIPQGPLSSAFLAECLLFEVDQIQLSGVAYLRYVDDIRLLSKRPQPILRALISLDLASKQFGLVPQAQKITKPRKASTVGEIVKSIPSLYLPSQNATAVSQAALWSLFRSSLAYQGKLWNITDKTKFSFALNRMNFSRRVLSIVSDLAVRYPDLADTISSFLIRCGKNVHARDSATKILATDPIYDAVAESYINVLQSCSPGKPRVLDLRLVEKVQKTSVERSILIELAASLFIATRKGEGTAVAIVDRASSALVKGLLIDQLFVGGPYKIAACKALLVRGCANPDADFARYCAATILTSLPRIKWPAKASRNRAVSLLLYDVGVTRVRTKRSTVLEVFFKEKLGIQIQMPWSKVFGVRGLVSADEKCLRMQQLSGGDPSTRITIVDAFNDLLIQYFCRSHPSLAPAYLRAKGKKHHPDIGAWLNQKDMFHVVPTASKWFREIHDARVKVDLAHAVTQSGQFTKPISHGQANQLMAGQRRAYLELLREWQHKP
jgi:hypothetical protein